MPSAQSHADMGSAGAVSTPGRPKHVRLVTFQPVPRLLPDMIAKSLDPGTHSLEHIAVCHAAGTTHRTATDSVQSGANGSQELIRRGKTHLRDLPIHHGVQLLQSGLLRVVAREQVEFADCPSHIAC